MFEKQKVERLFSAAQRSGKFARGKSNKRTNDGAHGRARGEKLKGNVRETSNDGSLALFIN
jgi:hypothetical protein